MTKTNSNAYFLMVAFAAAMGGLLFGYEIGVIGQVLDLDTFGVKMGYRFLNATSGLVETCSKDNYGVGCSSFEADTTGWVTFTFLIGCTVGALIVGYLADAIGRKWSIMSGSFLFVVGAFIQTFSASIGYMYPGRIVSGLGVGIMSMAVPLYISETSPTDTRGKITTSYQLMITIGILIAGSINAGIIFALGEGSELAWRLCMGIQAIPGILLVIAIVFLPYSPRWLANQDRDSEALEVLARLRNADIASDAIQGEFHEIKSAIDDERKIGSAGVGDLIKPGIINRVGIIIMLQLFQQFTGINGVMYYQKPLYKSIGFSSVAQQLLTIGLDLVNVFGTLPGMFLIDRVGRKTLLVIGGIGIAVSHAMICTFVKLSEVNPSYGWGAFFFIAIFDLFFASTWGPVVWSYQSEIFPLRCRAKGTSAGTMANWIGNALVSKLQPYAMVYIGPFTYVVYSVFGILMAVFVTLCVPETAGKSLEEIDEVFSKVDSYSKFKHTSKDIEFSAHSPISQTSL